MILTKEEQYIYDFYTNYSKNIRLNPQFKQKDLEWSLSGYKEKIWISILQKIPIHSTIETILFKSTNTDEQSIINELDSLVESLNKTKPS